MRMIKSFHTLLISLEQTSGPRMRESEFLAPQKISTLQKKYSAQRKHRERTINETQ